MELFYTPTSPYSRKIQILADHLGLNDRIKMTFLHPLFDKTGQLAAANPLEKVPTLVLDNGDCIFDSPVIADALYHFSEAPALPFEERLKQQQLQALGDGIMDAAVLSQMEKMREDAEQSEYWQDRWQKAIIRSIDEFENNMIQQAEEWHIGSMSMACALDYLDLRHPHLHWTTHNKKTYEWYQLAVERDTMITTDPRQA
ncbi:MAG: glutathione S-transferase N-terminal domain-containing protein [Emcibacter sp.]|nr:glutathione S-transferase N-terminal domain-containing protein [Emcibacter sp.]